MGCKLIDDCMLSEGVFKVHPPPSTLEEPHEGEEHRPGPKNDCSSKLSEQLDQAGIWMRAEKQRGAQNKSD